MKRKEKKAIEALKLLGLNPHVTKEDIIKKTDLLTKDNFEGNSCKNYTELSDIYAASQYLINHYDMLKDLTIEEEVKPFKSF